MSHPGNCAIGSNIQQVKHCSTIYNVFLQYSEIERELGILERLRIREIEKYVLNRLKTRKNSKHPEIEIKSRGKQSLKKKKITGENDEIGLLGEDHPLDKGCGIKVRASGELAGKHVLARRGLAVPIMHIGHLQYLKLPIFPKPQLLRLLLLLLFRSKAPDRKQIERKKKHD